VPPRSTLEASTSSKEQIRDARTGAGLESLLQDLRFAARTVDQPGIGNPDRLAAGAPGLAAVGKRIAARRAASVNPIDALRAQ
jgi:hypothetical protein